MGGSRTYPYGSTSAVRAHVLAALGVLKLATADQMHRLMAPGHKDNKAFRNAALDLARHGLAVSEGSARDGNKLWEPDAARTGRGSGSAGQAGGGDGRDGAWCGPFGCPARDGGQRDGHRHHPHARHGDPARAAPAARPDGAADADADADGHGHGAGSQAPGLVLEAQGMGWIGSWSTEVPLNLPTSRGNRAGVRADAVLQAAEAGLPVLFVEVDNCTESADILAAKFEKYLPYFRLKSKNPLGSESPVWRTQYPSTGREGHPPVVVVFNPGTRTGPQALKNRMNTVMELTRLVWSGSYHVAAWRVPGRRTGRLLRLRRRHPLLFTTLDRLQTSGPRTAVWWRCGHGQWETLPDALTNPADHDAWYARDEQRRHAA